MASTAMARLGEMVMPKDALPPCPRYVCRVILPFAESLNASTFTALVALGSLVAGFLGSLTGLGGGVVIVPMLTLLFGVDFRYAVGASLVAVIATSSGAAAAYVREGYTNIRIGMLLEVATTIGAIFGAFLAGLISTSVLAIVFGVVLIYSAYSAIVTRAVHMAGEPDPLAVRLRLNGSYPGDEGERHYLVQRVPLGFGLMFGAGTLSGLLGIGSGAVKVIAMDQAMRLPFKVSTTTSNFMIGVTAAASAGIYIDVRVISSTSPSGMTMRFTSRPSHNWR